MSKTDEPSFACDAMLGRLARWLRAAGYDACWRVDIEDRDLVRLAQREQRVLLTCDGGIFEFALVRDGQLPALLIPRQLQRQEQVRFVLQRLHLPLREPRCMACGGALVLMDRSAARQRVPPRTFDWLTEFYACSRCQRVFWQGTHWKRIALALEQASGRAH